MQQITNLLHLYNGLQISSIDETHVSLVGNILVNCASKGFTLYKEYTIKIVIPVASEELPYVVDTGNQIDRTYPHKYTNGKLCLETDTNIRVRFIDGFSLEEWMSEYVEPYFFSYEFYQRYGEFPFGERGHGLEGTLQTYSELFKETDYVKIIKIMASISSNQYRGHALCPCESGKKLRSCHGPFIMKFYTDDRYKVIVQNDYLLLKEAVKKHNEQR